MPISRSGARVAQPGGQSRELLAVGDVVGEEADPADPVLDAAEDPGGRLGPGEAREDAGRREPFELDVIRAPRPR